MQGAKVKMNVSRPISLLMASLLAALRWVWGNVVQLGRRPAPLLALLTLLGSFAFQARVGGSLSLPAPAPAAAHAHHHHGPADKSGHPAHDHSAHCPFCLTQVFGEVPNVPFVPLESGDFQPASSPQWTRPPPAPLSTIHARAPPLGSVPDCAASVRPTSTRT